jgi:hypothetical protein
LWHQKAVFFLHVIYPRVWIITKQTKRWNMSLGLEETPPGSERVLCRPRGQRASRLTMQHITPSSSSECTLGKSFFFFKFQVMAWFILSILSVLLDPFQGISLVENWFKWSM